MKTKTYRGSSCHEVGYAWTLKAPPVLSTRILNHAAQLLVDWTDEPNYERWCEMIEQAAHDGDEIIVANQHALLECNLYVESVHRNCFWNDNFKEQK